MLKRRSLTSKSAMFPSEFGQDNDSKPKIELNAIGNMIKAKSV